MLRRTDARALGLKKVECADDAYSSHVDNFAATWNVAPPHSMPIARLVNDDVEQRTARWGLLPSWSRDEKVKFRTHNARCETLATAVAYRSPYRRKQRCLVPAAGFYEWQVLEAGRKPPFHGRADGDLLVFAGLWDSWRRPNGETLTTVHERNDRTERDDVGVS